MTKKIIKEELESLDVNYVSAESVIRTLQSYIDKYGVGNVSLEKQRKPYEDGEYIAVFIEKMETDEQEIKRELEESYREKIIYNRELAQYQLLKEKFEINNNPLVVI